MEIQELKNKIGQVFRADVKINDKSNLLYEMHPAEETLQFYRNLAK